MGALSLEKRMLAFAASCSNGDVYVGTGYDPKTQKTKTLSTRLLGKILWVDPNYPRPAPKSKRSEVIEVPVQAVDDVLDFKKSSSGQVMNPVLMRISSRSFEIGDALKLSSIARAPGSRLTVTRCRAWNHGK